MAQTSITLTASMRSNLSSLRSIQKQMDTTQERLSSGKKVNSAIDNASSYYQARTLTNRAADLDSLLDSMGQGIQTIQAANEGIEAITSYVEQLKSIATSAFALDATAATYKTDLQAYEDQYNDVLKEIATLAKDSSYQGVNLLKGNSLTVMFNETRTHSLVIEGDDVVTEMNATGASGFAWKVENNEQVGNIDWKTDVAPTFKKETSYAMKAATGLVVGQSLAGLYTFDDDTDTWTQLSTGIAAEDPDNAGEVLGTYYVIDEDTAPTTAYVTAQTENSTTLMTKIDQTATYIDAQGNSQAGYVDAALDAIANVNTYLRSYATELGNNFTIIETRQNFTEALVDVLETGSDNLVLADMNEESANYLALQTRQQLAVNSLALASQSAQSVLSLF